MNKRLKAHLVWTAFASPLLIVLGGALNSIGLRWLASPFIMPGVTVTGWLGGMHGHMPNFGLLFLMWWLCNWMLLFLAAQCFLSIEILVMQARIKRLITQLVMTASASAILNLLVFVFGNDSIVLPFYSPGIWGAEIVLPGGDHSLKFFEIMIVLNFVIIWITLLLVVKLSEFFIARSKLKAAN